MNLKGQGYSASASINTRHLKRLFFCILSPIIVGVSLVSLLPLLLYRWILSQVHFQIYGTHILRGESVFYPVVFSELQKRSNVLLTIKVDGKFNHKEILNLFSARLVEAKLTNNNKTLRFPEFKQFIVNWMGYGFWRNEENFRIEEHVQNCSNQKWSEEFEEMYIDQPFSEGKSPWEILLMEATTPGSHYVLIKWHHSIGDGYSILHSLLSGTGNQKEHSPRPLQKLSVSQIICYPFLAIIDFLDLINQHDKFERSAIHIPISKMSDTRSYVSTGPISKDMLKLYCAKHGVSFSAGLFGMISTGLSKFLQEHGKGPVPKFLSCELPVPGIKLDGGSVQNSFGLTRIPLPTAKGLSVTNRMDKCEKFMSVCKRSSYSITTQLLRRLFGCLPWQLWPCPAAMPPVFISSFPGPKSSVSLNSKSVLDMKFTLHCAASYPILMTILTYNGWFRIVVAGDKEVFPDKNSLGHLVNILNGEFNITRHGNTPL